MSGIVEPTTGDYRAYLDYLESKERLRPYSQERQAATFCSWDLAEYQKVFAAFVISTGLQISDDEATTSDKGKPLEALGCYLLERSGFAVGPVAELKVRNKFQVDGHGSLNSGATHLVFGEDQNKYFPDFYFEAKNHNTPMNSQQFGHHCDRMSRAKVRCGVCLSAAGYSIGNGQGYNADLYLDWVRGTVHLLLNIEELQAIADDEYPPLVAFKKAYERVKTRQYETQQVWKRFCSTHNLELLKAIRAQD